MIDAVGVWFYSVKTDRYLYLLRNDHKHPFTWGLPGGKVENQETLFEALTRECQEELGQWPEPIKLVPVEKFTSNDNNFSYHTFFCMLEDEFMPNMNDEHCGYAWIESGAWPKPLHPGLRSTVQFEEVMQKINIVQKNQMETF